MPTTQNLDEDFTVYADIDAADLYLNSSFHADTWRLTTTTPVIKDRALLTATRLLNRQIWPGTVAVVGQALAWPRINTGIEGVTDGVIPQDIIDASIELALAFLDGVDVQNQQTTRTREQSIRAGSVAITNFRMVEEYPLRWPLIINELLAKYLGSGASLTGFGAKAYGTDTPTQFPHVVGFNRGL